MKDMQARLRNGLLDEVALDPGVRADLTLEWRPQIEQLASLIDFDIDVWLRPESARTG